MLNEEFWIRMSQKYEMDEVYYKHKKKRPANGSWITLDTSSSFNNHENIEFNKNWKRKLQ